jgi:PmbA protein
MLGESTIKERIEHILVQSRADQTEVLLMGESERLTRFANSYIHQNTATDSVAIRVRVVLGKRIGIASTNDLSDQALDAALESAMTAARFQQENPDFVSLPGPEPIPAVDGFVERTAACTPETRAQAVKSICMPSRDRGLSASGALATSRFEYAVGNSLGVSAYYPTTLADLRTVVMSDTGSGYADAASLDVEEIDAESVGRDAIDKAQRSRDPISIPPGEYAVILEESAVSEMLAYLAYMGFSALAVQEERSFMSGRLGEVAAGENVSVWDDGLDPTNLPMPFDFEGVPKQRVDFIRKGVIGGPVYDSYTAGREEGKRSTGHALPAPNSMGPFPWNVIMETGDAGKEEMVAATDRGIWVTRFHYVRPVHPLKTIITGMTRDGTFLIEKGELTRPVRNLRFTQSVLETLSDVQMLGREAKIGREGFMENFIGGVRAPALKIGRFTFTSATES